MAPGEPDAWTARLGDEEHPGLQPVVAAVNPQARLSPLDPEQIDAGPAVLAWEIRIDPDEEPFAESPIANIVRISNVSRFQFPS
jgi:hypothetical protein